MLFLSRVARRVVCAVFGHRIVKRQTPPGYRPSYSRLLGYGLRTTYSAFVCRSCGEVKRAVFETTPIMLADHPLRPAVVTVDGKRAMLVCGDCPPGEELPPDLHAERPSRQEAEV